MAVTGIAFLDTSVLLAGLVDFGDHSRLAHLVLHAVEQKTVTATTAWHCCLEFYSVATRLPPEYRLTPDDAVLLLQKEVLDRLTVHELPPVERLSFLAAAARDRSIGGRIYDAHIADVARSTNARVIVTDNRKHFLSSLRHGIRVETPDEFLASLRQRRG